MGRRRKNDTGVTVKPAVSLVPVRKSTRQIARKQFVEDKKVNGELSKVTNCVVDPSPPPPPPPSQVNNDDIPIKPKAKPGRPRKINRDKIVNNVNNIPENVVPPNKDIIVENNIIETTEHIVIPENIESETVNFTNSHEVLSEDVQQTSEVVWPDGDVIEETIICEEMEVDGDDMETSRYTIDENGSIVLEQVLLTNESNFDGKEVVEFTVIQHEDGSESMVISGNNGDNTEYQEETSEYIIEENVEECIDENITTVNDCENSIISETIEVTEVTNEQTEMIIDEKEKQNNEKVDEKSGVSTRRRSSLLNNSRETRSTVKSMDKNNSSVIGDNSIKDSPIPPSPSPVADENGSSTNSPVTVPERRRKSKSLKEKTKKSISPSDLQRELSTIKLDDTPVETINSTEDSSSSNVELSSLPAEDMSTSASLLLSSSMQNGDGEKSDEIETEKIIERMTMDTVVDVDTSNRTPTPDCDSTKLPSQVTTIEETSRESSSDVKTDSEDVKLSSGSENSNDTSSMSMKITSNFDEKSASTSSTPDGDKKVGFRSRSGSTDDTTGSESGSNNSSAVRRSSRIRSQGLMNKRSRGRGLVTKPTAEISKVLQQEREKLQLNNTPVLQSLRDTLDSQLETQSDKENSNKAPLSDSNTPLISTTPAGYDSDSSKPVKVKSRWRRSSELEMGGSAGSRMSFGSLGIISSAPTTPNSNESQTSTCDNTNSMQNYRDNDSLTRDSGSIPSSNASSPVPMAGTKLSLPMVVEEKDREMEERLSQFEKLKENLYLTERYTNKETKRMVCDCFLTEDEIERGELGCGDDCLNRLLMIECGSRCVVGNRCTNKRFQCCSYAKCEVFRTEKKGFGLRATADLSAGEFIMEYVGEVLDPRDFRRRAKEYSKDKNRHYYFMALKSDQVIDATMKGNISRFINHSCDPNAETQKWTVNGELRIGFFTRRFIAANEEITFDYHFQRYGKEAQKCFCESTNCRGWIGDTPEEEKEKIEMKEIRERERDRDVKRSKREVKKYYMEDEDLEEEIDKLCSGGLKNQAHTLTLSRLMVRSREIEHRIRLLRLIQIGEQPCRRLFLDYHGLRLIWSYMMDVASLETEEAQLFRLELLKTLSTLPIPNKTLLMDSKVFSVVQKWSTEEYPSPKSESPVEETAKTEKIDEKMESNCDSNDKPSTPSLPIVQEDETSTTPPPATTEIQKQFLELAMNLLNNWANLKEVFRIPKKERIEQMKEHEREADDGYREQDVKKEEKKEPSAYERHRSDRYGRRRGDTRGRDSPDIDGHRSKEKRNDDRTNLVNVPKLSKYERRQLFALKVAKEEEERMRRQQQEMWQEHETRCLALGIDPHTTAAVDPQTGYPLFFNPTLGQWQSYPLQEGGPDVYLGGTHQHPPSLTPQEILPPTMANYGINAPVTYPGLSHQAEPPPFDERHLTLPNNCMPVHNDTTPPIPMTGHVHLDKPMEIQFPEVETPTAVTEPEMPMLDLPPKWKAAKDSKGRFYYYHVKERIPQWLPPPPIHILPPDSTSSEESSEESSSSEDEIEEVNETADTVMREDTDPLGIMEQVKAIVMQDPRTVNSSHEKRRRDGLVQERIISPRREESRGDHKRYKDVKEKLRRQKERAKMKELMEKQRKHRRADKAKSHARHTANKLQAIAESSELTAERKIKDTFRINMANVIVRFLNPFRQNDCKQGRITNTEDFKYLARKLTHAVMNKELKHLKSVEELQCNENVKHKAKDFVRKYMGKFGPAYQRSSDEDREF